MAETWTVLNILQWTENFFRERGISEPRLDAQILLADLLGLERVGLYLNFDRPLAAAELAEFRGRVSRRARREPVQYILGKMEFWSLSLEVTPAVLIPRADTEVLVEEALRLCSGEARILDVGTGSGAIALALAHEKPGAEVKGIDISPEALSVAEGNARRNGLEERVAFEKGDFFALPPGPWDLIVANPPYIPTADLATLMAEVRDFEPRQALDGGADGLDCYRALANQTPARLAPRGWILVEVGAGQAESVRELFKGAGLTDVFIRSDYAGIPRVVGGRRDSHL